MIQQPKILKALTTCRSGGAALEFALVSPLLLALCMFAVEAGAALMDYRRVVVAAETGGDIAAAYPRAGRGAIENAAAVAFGPRGAERFEVAVGCSAKSEGAGHRLLTVDAHYASPFRAMLGGAITVSARSVRVVQSDALCETALE